VLVTTGALLKYQVSTTPFLLYKRPEIRVYGRVCMQEDIYEVIGMYPVLHATAVTNTMHRIQHASTCRRSRFMQTRNGYEGGPTHRFN
jgi:hypothetical protein